MAEYIDRQAAIDVLCDACGNAACPKGLIPRCSFYERMQAIPAADVRPVVRGEWGKRLNPSFSPFDDSGAYLYRCNQCGHIQNYESNFCPNCGADMREES